jgi:hypothetical protein
VSITASHTPTPDDLCIWLARQAAAIRSGGHAYSGFLADQVDGLARSAAFSLACTPEDLIDRIEVLENDRVRRAVDQARARDMTYGDHR